MPGGAEGADEVDDDGVLGGAKAPVPDDVNGDVTLQRSSVVVLEDEGLLLEQGG